MRLHTSLEWPQSADYDSGPSHTEGSPSQAESLSPATNLCSTSMSRRLRNTATISAAATTIWIYVTSRTNDFACCNRCYQSVNLSFTFVHCVEDIDKISFLHDSIMSFPDSVKIWLALVNSFLPKFCPKLSNPAHVDLKHSTVNCG